jgi:tRNA 5-methylaminomethyl-2-thiouridine biosynthesis bifunctional protein
VKTAIVIGGGIAGCSTAYALAKRGISVTLIERHEKLAQEASGNQIGVLYPKFGAKQDATSLLALQGFQFTLDLLNQLASKEKVFDTCGLIQLAFNAREKAKLQALANSSAFEFLNSAEASEIAGVRLKTGGLYLPQAGWLKPTALCEALSGLPLITKKMMVNALKIKKCSGTWRVLDDKNNAFEADMVVICNANDIKQFKQYQSAAITPVRGQLNLFKQTNESQHIKTVVCSDHYLSPAVDGWHCIGTTYSPNDMSLDVRDADTHENLNALRAITPEIYQHIDMDSIQSRVAWRSQTRDYLPLAGQLIDETVIRDNPPRYNANPTDLPWLEGLYVNAGHGSKGMITAPICGELIASLAAVSDLPIEPKLSSKLNPSRFLLRELGLKQLANSLYN